MWNDRVLLPQSRNWWKFSNNLRFVWSSCHPFIEFFFGPCGFRNESSYFDSWWNNKSKIKSYPNLAKVQSSNSPSAFHMAWRLQSESVSRWFGEFEDLFRMCSAPSLPYFKAIGLKESVRMNPRWTDFRENVSFLCGRGTKAGDLSARQEPLSEFIPTIINEFE